MLKSIKHNRSDVMYSIILSDVIKVTILRLEVSHKLKLSSFISTLTLNIEVESKL